MDKKSYKTLNILKKTDSKDNFKTVELLAPARDLTCAMTAINCGADAVYLGAQNFGARKKAGNSIEDIKKIVDYAHIFNVKIYVTVNTVLFDEELSEVEKLINNLYDIGVDALIIQDLGILKLNLPPIELHASTQCHNFDVEKIKFLQSMNISRFVLPREFSLEQIKNVKTQTGTELEFFIHGALCVSYSGQCYLSQSIGGRSANRGECAQPCRNKYSLIDENGNYIIKDKYLLSLKDLCLIDNLEALAESGVYSFKIEGRLKDEDYVKTTVSAYRNRIEASKTLKNSSDGVIITEFEPDLKKVFNRGFTTYNIGFDNINSIDTPKNRGEFVGKVKDVFKDGFEISLNKGFNLNPNDGLSAFINGNLQGSTITKIQGNKIFLLTPLSLKSGDKIFRNLDFEYQKYIKTSHVERKLPVIITININEDKIDFYANSKENCAKIELKNDFEPAQKDQSENIKKQFSKLGETPFLLKSIDIKGKIPFIPVSKLNEIRRNLCDKLQKEIIKNHKFVRRDTSFTVAKFPENIKNDYKLNITNKNAAEIYKEGGIFEPQKGFEASEHIKNAVLMQTKNCLKKLAGICSKNGNFYLQDSFGNRYPLRFDCKNCVMEILNYE